MPSKDRSISPKIIIGLVAFGGIVITACVILFSVRSTIAGLLIPQESDFPGMSDELNALGETPNFISASWIGNPLYEVEIHGYAPENTSIDKLRLVQCPALLEIANLFVGDNYDIEIHVSNSSRVPCN